MQNNYNKYHFNDFTISKYKEILKVLKINFNVSLFHSYNKKDKFVVLRHDIDFSPQRALRIANIEYKEGIRSTYFIHLHSEYYNIFEKGIFETFVQILNMGHELGIHFDTHFYNIDSEDKITKILLLEKQILENLFNVNINCFSFHNTNPFIMTCKKDSYADLINTYSAYFQNEVNYCSDSNGYWKYNRLSEYIKNPEIKNLQLLIHPEWWQEEPMSPAQKIKRCIYGRADQNYSNYKKLLSSYNNLNIDW